jgi:hypothetical protein
VRLPSTSLAALAVALAAAGVAQAAIGRPQADSAGAEAAARKPLLWATINFCDTELKPNRMGVRGSMPGNGLRQRMYMRFTAQSYSASLDRWRTVPRHGVSRWVLAGSARYVSRQTGWTFEFRQPSPGVSYRLRAKINFQWRARRRGTRRWIVKKRRTRYTRAGLRGVRSGDPKGTSLRRCVIS